MFNTTTLTNFFNNIKAANNKTPQRNELITKLAKNVKELVKNLNNKKINPEDDESDIIKTIKTVSSRLKLEEDNPSNRLKEPLHKLLLDTTFKTLDRHITNFANLKSNEIPQISNYHIRLLIATYTYLMIISQIMTGTLMSGETSRSKLVELINTLIDCIDSDFTNKNDDTIQLSKKSNALSKITNYSNKNTNIISTDPI